MCNSMARLTSRPIFLDAKQEAALREHAKARKTSLLQEVRNAIDTYLAGATPEELELLDAATKVAGQDLAHVAQRLNRTNRRLDKMFVQMQRIRRDRA